MSTAVERRVFVDLETTGLSPARARITDIALIEDGADGPVEWTTLINPGEPIPVEIEYLTGISNALVRTAPRFEEIAATLLARIDGAVLIAHNARFDYAFLKAEFARVGMSFRARTLCTARLARLLEPEPAAGGGHGLDALIVRHGLRIEVAPQSTAVRHRALGDAYFCRAFLIHAGQAHGATALDLAIARLLKRPSLPTHLAPDALDAIPHAPGVYLFHGLNPHPIYIGRSIDLRDRVGSHFTNDHRHERELRIAQEVRRIEWETCAGEFATRLREWRLIGERLPAHNQALRRQSGQIALRLGDDGRIVFAKAAAVEALLLARDHAGFARHAGPFGNRAAARRWLGDAAPALGLCLAMLGLEKRSRPDAPCFNRQLGKCAGACVGAESAESHRARVGALLAERALPPWPFAHDLFFAIEFGAHPAAPAREVQVFDRWCWLGSASTSAEIDALVTVTSRRFAFEPARWLMSFLAMEGQIRPLSPA